MEYRHADSIVDIACQRKRRLFSSEEEIHLIDRVEILLKEKSYMRKRAL